MCDVDTEAVVSAVDAPSIYDIPKVLHTEGLDAYVVRRLGLPFRDVDWTVWDDLLRPGAPPEPDGHGRAGRQVRRPAGRVPVGDGGAAGRRVRAPDAGSRSAGCPPTTAPPRTARPRQLAGVDGVLIPGGFGVRGIEGKLGAIRYARERGIPTLGLCLGLQCMVIETARDLAGLDGRELDRVRPGRPRTRSSPRWPTRSTSSPGSGTWAARCGSGRTRSSWSRAPWCRGVRADRGLGAAPAPLRGQQRLPRAAQRGRSRLLRHVAGRPAGRVRRAAARGAPVLRRHPGPPGVHLPADPPAAAVPGVRRGRAGARARPTGSRSTSSRPRAGTRPTTMDGRSRASRRDRASTPSRPAPSTPDTYSRAGRRGPDARRRGQDPRGRRAARCGRHRRPRRGRRVVLIRQYRHPVGELLVEMPAGLLDVRGRRPAAPPPGSWPRRPPHRRPLATCWWTCTSRPGCRPRRCGSSWPATSRRCRTRSGTSGTHEEADIDVHWVPLEELSQRCSPARCATRSPWPACSRRRRAGTSWATLRPADAPGRPGRITDRLGSPRSGPHVLDCGGPGRRGNGAASVRR